MILVLLFFLLTDSAFAQPDLVPYNLCSVSACTPECNASQTCGSQVGMTDCYCIDCAIGCPASCLCTFVLQTPGSDVYICNSSCGQEPAPLEPAPVEPMPVEPAPVQPEPVPTEPAPVEPAPTEPAPIEQPMPVEPAPIQPEPVPTEPAPVEPAPTEPAPIEQPMPVEPAPMEPAPVEPAPVEPAPTEPAPVGPAPVEPAPLPIQPAPLPVQPAPVQPSPLPVQPSPLPVQPSPLPIQPSPSGLPIIPVLPIPNCTVVEANETVRLPFCGDTMWSCATNIQVPTDLEALCHFDAYTFQCGWLCPAPGVPTNQNETEICLDRCSQDTMPTQCVVGTLPGNETSFNAVCRPQMSQTGTLSCLWSTNCMCRIANVSGKEMCGNFAKPDDPCQGTNGTLTSFKCVMDEALGTCTWNVICVLSTANGVCAGQCPMTSMPSACANGTVVPRGADFAADCVSASNGSGTSGSCAWQTNCIVDECANACTAPKPTSCPSPYALRFVDQAKGVQCDCAKPTTTSQCTWIPRNCYPVECRVRIENSSLYCGNEILNCPLPLNLDPVTACSKNQNGNCTWNFQCPSAESCGVTPDMASYSLGGQAVPTCGGLRRPSCNENQTFSSNCGCERQQSTCEWQNNCEALAVQKPQCYLRKTSALGWVCGATPVTSCCADGSSFIPTYCEQTQNGGCTPRGFCNRRTVVDIDLSIIVQIATNQTQVPAPAQAPAQAPQPAQQPAPQTQSGQQLTCSGNDQPKCTMGTPLIPARCVCEDMANGDRLCYWTSLVCQVDHVCTSCSSNPCSDAQYMDCGNCINGPSGILPVINNTNPNVTQPNITNGNNTNNNGNCQWTGLICKEKATAQCTCDNIPPTECPYGKARDMTQAPVCLRGISGGCVLQSQCIPDTCGGLGTSPCQCDFSKCVYVFQGGNGNSSSSNNTGNNGGYAGCFAPSSDIIRVLSHLPNIQLYSSAPDLCAQVAQSTTPETNCKCIIIENCSRTISDQTQMTDANKVLVDQQTLLLTEIDNQTGTMLGRHFTLSMIVLATPLVHDDLSMDLTVIVNFVPRERIFVASKDHQRVFCPCVKRFVSKLAKFDENITQNADCNWKPLLGNDTTTQPPVITGKTKRGLLQQQQGSTLSPFAGGNTYTATLTFPADAVKRTFGATSQQAPAMTPGMAPGMTPGMAPAPGPMAPGTGIETPVAPSIANSTTGSEPVGGSGSISRALLLWIITAAAAMFIFGF